MLCVVCSQQLACDAGVAGMLVKNDPVKRNKVTVCLQTLAIRMLRPLVSEKVFSGEIKNAKLVGSLPAHRNLLREHVLRPGVSLSTLYDVTLKEHVRYGKMERTGAQCVLLALAKGLQHLHDHGVGHFDVKPSNILVNMHVVCARIRIHSDMYTYTRTQIKFPTTRSLITEAWIVLADFGLACTLDRGMCLYIFFNSYILNYLYCLYMQVHTEALGVEPSILSVRNWQL